MLSLDFDHARFERDSVRADYDLEIGVTANLSLRVAEKVIYQELMFPIVELRVALDRWVQQGPDTSDFEFVSMESDETGLVWLRRQPSGSWRAGSVHQDTPAVEEFDWGQIATAIERYKAHVDQWLEANLDVRVSDVVDL